MGLLDKALSRYSLQLDDKGKRLRDRILRIAEKGTTPYTALSLLKTYGSFQCGICLRLIQDTYTGYASVGLGIEKTLIPLERLPPQLQGTAPAESGDGRRFCIIGSPALLGISAIESDARIWAFPLDERRPSEYLVLLAEASQQGEAPFKASWIARILEDISQVFRGPPLKAPKPAQEASHDTMWLPEPEAEPELPLSEVRREILTFYSRRAGRAFEQNPVQGMLFALSGDVAPVLSVLAPLGALIRVASQYLLILFHQPADRDLLAHRLSRSVGLITVAHVEAESPEALLELLRPYSPYAL
ncbi:MAG: hypothetical protein LBD74_01915 [Spirochaetaceae bacterium]|jgi:hypothetical protein|nr:hypothetical protein [Spirochaetaceae bacterium]